MPAVNITFTALDVQDDRALVRIEGSQPGESVSVEREIVWGDFTANISNQAQSLEEYLQLLAEQIIPQRLYTESEEPGSMSAKINNLTLRVFRD